MEKIIYFDYCAFIILCILLITTISRKMTHGRQNRWFLYIMIITLITTVADICAVNLDRSGAGNVLAKYIFNTIYLTAHMMTTPCYILYLLTLTDIWHRLNKRRSLYLLIFSPLACGIILLLLNPFTHTVYYLDETDTYTRGSWFFILYMIAAIYTIGGIVLMCWHRKLFTKGQFAALIAVFPISILVAVIQFFRPEYILELFANTAAITFVSMFVQRPENLLDADTGLGKLSAYVTNVQNSSMTSKRMQIIMLNIVNYSILRDMLGYQSTNVMLRNIADHLIALNKKHNVGAEFYYLGQGKFRMIMDSRHFEKTAELADLICRAMRPSFLLNQMSLNVVTNVCIAKYPEDIDSIDSLLAFGNDLNQIPFTGHVMYASELYKKDYYDIQKDIDRIMEEALAEHKFEVYYQPIYSVAEQRFNSAEALLRLKTDKYGFISPELFIPAAEKSGAIHKIGSFVMDEVCRFIASNDFQNLNIDYIEVNLSVAQCMQDNLAKDILDTLNTYHVKPDQINLEITETAASYSQKTMMQNLRQLREAGISFSLDDFGTGYSNMRRIASLPLHIVKLDKSFTNIDENPKLLIVLKNTIHMIKDMNMKIVVEGIETESMVKQFSELECEYIQGYFYSRPIPQNEFVSFIRKAKEIEMI